MWNRKLGEIVSHLYILVLPTFLLITKGKNTRTGATIQPYRYIYIYVYVCVCVCR
ncbi:hypothetical protein BDF14DRAFT_603858 [Spinellus fusiger]|nr:hypothetical protein BDF14DRAFT_603858 [Spinellus fusiger]